MAADTPTGLTSVELFNFKRNLKAALEVYQEVDDAHKQKLLDYLIDGSNPGCLLELKAAMAQSTKPFFSKQHSSLQPTNTQLGSKLMAVLQQHPVPSGYYPRLAEWFMLHSQVASAINGDPRLPEWINALARVFSVFRMYSYGGKTQLHVLPMASEMPDEQVTAFIDALVGAESGDYWSIPRTLASAEDVVDLFLQRTDDLCRALKPAPANCAEATLTLLLAHKADYTAIMPTLVDLLTSGGKKVKAVATQLVAQNLEAARAPLSEKLKSGSAGERTAAVEVMAQLYGLGALAELKEALAAEKGARLRQSLEEFIRQLEEDSSGSQSTTTASSEAVTIDLPPVDMPDDPIPLPPGFREALAKMFETADVKLEEQYQRQFAYYSSQKHSWMSKPARLESLTSQQQEELCLYLEGSNKKPITHPRFRPALFTHPIETWYDIRQLHLIHIVRLMFAAGLIGEHNDHLHVMQQMILAHRAAQSEPYGLREIDAAIGRLFAKPGLMVQAYLGYARATFELEDAAVWPLFHEHPDKLRDAILGVSMGKHDYYIAERRRNAIAIAGMLPALPKSIENAMWAIALGEAKTDRPLVRRALSKASGHLQRGLQAIQDGKQSIRIAGAELLAELGDSAAVEPLKKALKAEKQEAVKGSILQAIELLGGDVEEFLGRRKQLLDAKKALEKKMPKGMEWFPLDALPTVRWAEDDKPVAAEIVRWWVIQSVQFKLPTCGALLRRAMGMCRSDDAAALAKFVLSAWIGYDTQVPNPADTLAAATERAHKEYKTAKWIQDYFKSEEAYRDNILQQMQGQFLNSATGEKGALAVVSAGGDKHCVRIIEKYIRTYHGHRLAQSKALLEVLGWIDDPLAIQVLLSIGNRFRTAAIRKRAAEMVQELADRKGWTMEQLADRTIPDAGFVQAKDEDGRPVGKRAELVLDYGARKFTVIMNDDLEPVISREDGKEVKALPAAAKDDDPELVKTAKAEFTAAKKTVKDVVKLLAEQLYEAVCSQRTWIASEWKSFLATHPIAGALCRRVIWRAQPAQSADQHADQSLSRTALAAVGDTESRTALAAVGDAAPPTTGGTFFRPLEDGTFTDVNDNSIELADTDIITVAHSSLMSSEEEQAWIDHLKDYEVPRLFVQFGRQTYRLTESDLNKTEIDAFKGHMLTTFILRNKATKLGWQRGAAQDGGSFSVYFKPFRASGITAMLEFTGSYVPEQDIPAGLRNLYFVPIRGNEEEADTWNPPKMKLAKVPAILISECYNDIRDIAAEGTGFDPEWEKKGLW